MRNSFKMSRATKYLANVLALTLFLNVLAVFFPAFNNNDLSNCTNLFVISQLFEFWGQIIISVLGLVVYILILRIQKSGKWNTIHTRIIYIIAGIVFTGFLLVAFSGEIKDLFLIRNEVQHVNAVSCPTLSSVMGTKNIIPNTLNRLMYNPMLWVSILSLIFIADFMKYAYGIKKEDESFI